MFVEFIFFLGLLVFWWYRNDKKKYAKHPPGPQRIPFFGNVFQLLLQHDLPTVAFKKLADIYGDVMFLKLGRAETVVFTSHDAVRDMLMHDKTLGRTQFELVRDRHNNKNLGIIWGQGRPWHTLRRFTIRNLRDYGFGKSMEMDVVINEELTKFMEHIQLESSLAQNNVLHVKDLFGLSMVNVIWRLVTGKSYAYNDSRMLHLLELYDNLFRSSNLGFDVTHAFPILREWFPDWAGRTLQMNCVTSLSVYGKELIEEHKSRAESDPQCFIDLFAAKIEEHKDDPDTDFTDEQLLVTVLDLLIGGSETSSKSLTFAILYMLVHPHVQEKVQEEIDKIPRETPISTSMKSILPYTTATTLEILRYSTVVPAPTAREATEDFYFRGYLIKKGTSLIGNVHAVHYNKSLWGDPENFRPERFLDSTGTTVEKKPADLLLTFGAGKRFCLGQSLAESTLFLFFTTMLRNFRFLKVEGTNPTVEPVLGLSFSPYPFDVKIVPR